MREETQRGSVSVLIVGLAALIVAMIAVGIAATAVYLQHRHVVALADSLADAIAAGYDRPGYFDHGAGEDLVLTESSVRARCDRVLRDLPRGVLARVDDTRVSEVTVVGRTRVRVRVSARARLPVVPDFLSAWDVGVPLVASAHAQISAP